MINNYTKSRLALALGGSTVEMPTWMMLGSGSGTALATQTALINPWDRQYRTAIDTSVTNKVTWTFDWASTEVSGLSLKEFGLCSSGATTTGSIWSRTSMPAVLFNGTNELRIEETTEVF